MIPAALFLDQLPLTRPNRKIDRQALSSLSALGERLQSADYEKATTETQRCLVQLWAEILDILPKKI